MYNIFSYRSDSPIDLICIKIDAKREEILIYLDQISFTD